MHSSCHLVQQSHKPLQTSLLRTDQFGRQLSKCSAVGKHAFHFRDTRMAESTGLTTYDSPASSPFFALSEDFSSAFFAPLRFLSLDSAAISSVAIGASTHSMNAIGCGVALALSKFDDARVAAVTFFAARRDIGKKFFDRVLLPQHRQRGTSCVQ